MFSFYQVAAIPIYRRNFVARFGSAGAAITPLPIDAWVVLPDHLHCVLTLPRDTDDFPVRGRLIKSLFSKGLPRNERLSATRRKRSERGIWQRRYWEHTITTELDYSRHIDYIHVNPLKHGYVTRVQDLRYSTFHRHVQAGILPIDWVGDVELERYDFGENGRYVTTK